MPFDPRELQRLVEIEEQLGPANQPIAPGLYHFVVSDLTEVKDSNGYPCLSVASEIIEGDFTNRLHFDWLSWFTAEKPDESPDETLKREEFLRGMLKRYVVELVRASAASPAADRA